MENKSMDRITRSFGPAEIRLTGEETTLLHRLLCSADRYDGFVSETYVQTRRKRDTILGAEYRRYRIVFDAPDRFHIDCSCRYEGEDGSREDSHWGWRSAVPCRTLREVLDCLAVFGWELA